MRRLWYIVPIALVLYLAIAVGRAASTTGISRSCPVRTYIYGQQVMIHTRSYNMVCRIADSITGKSLHFVINHGGAGNGDFYIARTHCFAHGELPNDMHVSCRRNNGRMHYAT